VEVDDFNIGLLLMKSKDYDQITLDEFVETIGVESPVEITWKELPQLSTEVNHETEEALPEIKSTAVAVLEPVTTEPTIDSQVKDATTHLQNLLATVTDVQLKEAIVKEVLALV
jgi:hypothetical protein